jgi:hypothetical protein
MVYSLLPRVHVQSEDLLTASERLVWGGQSFTDPYNRPRMAIMCAEMDKDRGSRNLQELNLSEKIVNFHGQLTVV